MKIKTSELSGPICVYGGRCWADEHCSECPHDGDDLSALYTAIYEKDKNNTSGICQKCSGSGMQDSGGVHPWGETIYVSCDCKLGDEVDVPEGLV